MFGKLRINWKLVVRRRRCDLLVDCVESEKVGGVSMNWEHLENVLTAKAKAIEEAEANLNMKK